MTLLGILFTLSLVLWLWTASRQSAVLPLLICACYMTFGQVVVIAGLNFYVIRLVILAGLLRVLVRRETLSGGWCLLDTLSLLWALIALITSLFHTDPFDTFVNRLGRTYNALGLYLLFRVFISSEEDFRLLMRYTLLAIGPLSLLLLYEKLMGLNPFYVFGGVDYVSAIREGRIRAQGPFGNPINSGTLGALLAPYLIWAWRQSQKQLAVFGGLVVFLMIYSSASSGPIVTLLGGLVAMGLWRYRRHLKTLLWGGLFLYLGLAVVMNAPVYFLIARMRIVQGSTAYHRAALIDAAIQYLPEWWLYGTDYTRHWLPYGIAWSPEHVDITNYFINMGVAGGLPLLLAFLAIVVTCYQVLRRALATLPEETVEPQQIIWTLGSMLFAHLITFMGISYYDQLIVFWQMIVAAVASLGNYYAQREEETTSEEAFGESAIPDSPELREAP